MDSEIIGSIAGFLTTLCFVPQVIKTLKHENTSSISLLMYISFSIGVALWLAYGIMLGKLPLIISNGVTLILALIILGKKIINLVQGKDK